MTFKLFFVDPVPQQAPANHFIHALRLANASSKDVVTL